MFHLNFWILTFSTNFYPIKSDLSGNIFWPKRCSLCSQYEWDFFCDFQTVCLSFKVIFSEYFAAQYCGLRMYISISVNAPNSAFFSKISINSRSSDPTDFLLVSATGLDWKKTNYESCFAPLLSNMILLLLQSANVCALMFASLIDP